MEYWKTNIHILSGIFCEFRYSKVIQRQIFIFLNILKSDIPFLISAVSSRGRSRSFRKGGLVTKLWKERGANLVFNCLIPMVPWAPPLNPPLYRKYFGVPKMRSSVYSDHDSLWIEVQSDLHHNIVCGVIYRHHNSYIDAFLAYFNETIDKINREKKYCIIMGDFNLDLLKSDSHPPTEEFLSNLG